MDGVINLGPVALAADRLLAVTLLLAFVLIMDRIMSRAGERAVPVTGTAIVTGIVAARITYVVTHRDSFANDWWSTLAIWQGGFSAWAGLTVAAIVLIWRMRPVSAMRKGLAALALFSTAWFAGSMLIEPKPRPLPELPELVRLDGSIVTAEALAGRPFVLNLWATWCPPCRRELPMLAEIAEDTEIPILLVNQGEEPQRVYDFLLANQISPAAIVLDRPSQMMRSLESAALPTTLFVDRRGRVVATHFGEISRAALMAQITELKGV